jgi:tetratricopeptide (TPR) repeat protein
MQALPPQDVHHLRAAQGWLDLGDHGSAGEELEKVNVEFQEHPVVLAVRYQVLAKAKRWEQAGAVAQTLVQTLPESAFGWLRRSQALHFLGRTQEAWDQLFPAVEHFPGDPLIAYDLACYACQLGRLPEAVEWLKKALAKDQARQLKQAALEDPDLEPLRATILEL